MVRWTGQGGLTNTRSTVGRRLARPPHQPRISSSYCSSTAPQLVLQLHSSQLADWCVTSSFHCFLHWSEQTYPQPTDSIEKTNTRPGMTPFSSAVYIVQSVLPFQVEEPGRRKRRQAGKREWVEIESFKMDEKNGNFPKKPGEPVGEWDPYLISLERRSEPVASSL